MSLIRLLGGVGSQTSQFATRHASVETDTQQVPNHPFAGLNWIAPLHLSQTRPKVAENDSKGRPNPCSPADDGIRPWAATPHHTTPTSSAPFCAVAHVRLGELKAGLAGASAPGRTPAGTHAAEPQNTQAWSPRKCAPACCVSRQPLGTSKYQQLGATVEPRVNPS